MLHAKTATIDGVWSTVGTSNLDWWSIARDNEVNAIILGHKFGDEMDLMFKNDQEDSEQIELARWNERSLAGAPRRSLRRDNRAAFVKWNAVGPFANSLLNMRHNESLNHAGQ